MIEMAQLRGLPLERAELYGKPCVGAEYTDRRGGYRRTSDTCCVCGRPAQSCHHAAPRSLGKTFTLVTPRGTHELRSALLALCGSGTTGCHDGFHGGARYVARWVWDDEECEREWWCGLLLAIHAPHSPALYGYGRWEIEDRLTGRVATIREGY